MVTEFAGYACAIHRRRRRPDRTPVQRLALMVRRARRRGEHHVLVLRGRITGGRALPSWDRDPSHQILPWSRGVGSEKARLKRCTWGRRAP